MKIVRKSSLQTLQSVLLRMLKELISTSFCITEKSENIHISFILHSTETPFQIESMLAESNVLPHRKKKKKSDFFCFHHFSCTFHNYFEWSPANHNFQAPWQDFCRSCRCLPSSYRNGKEEGEKCNRESVSITKMFSLHACQQACLADQPWNPTLSPIPINQKVSTAGVL